MRKYEHDYLFAEKNAYNVVSHQCQCEVKSFATPSNL